MLLPTLEKMNSFYFLIIDNLPESVINLPVNDQKTFYASVLLEESEKLGITKNVSSYKSVARKKCLGEGETFQFVFKGEKSKSNQNLGRT